MRNARLIAIMNKVKENRSHNIAEFQSNQSTADDGEEEKYEHNSLESVATAKYEDNNNKKEDEVRPVDVCEFSSSPERLNNKSPSSFSADSDCLALATRDISRTPSTISNLSFILNQSDFVASPSVIFETRNFSGPLNIYHDDTIRVTPPTSALNVNNVNTIHVSPSTSGCSQFGRKIKKLSTKRSLTYTSVSDVDDNTEINSTIAIQIHKNNRLLLSSREDNEDKENLDPSEKHVDNFDLEETLTPSNNSNSILENCTFVGDENVTLTTNDSNLLTECQTSELINHPSTSQINYQRNSSPFDTRTNSTDKPKQLTRKRIVHKRERQDEKSKELKNRGEAYKGCRSKKIFEKKTLKPVCKCQKKCGEKFTKEQREAIMQKYYKLGDHERQWLFIANHTTTEAVKRITTVRKNNRTQSVKYYFQLNTEKVQVCKIFFINTLNISHQTVYTALEKNKIGCESSIDMRGKHDNRPHKMNIDTEENIIKHIRLFPTIESHYIRKDSTRQYLSEILNISKMYRLYKTWFEKGTFDCPMASKRQYITVFNTKFNYSFFKPKKDQCGTCTLYHEADITKKDELQEKFDRHQNNKKRVRQIKKVEKESFDNVNSTIAIFDLEKVLSIPQSQVGIFHYKRKYPVYNFTVYDASRLKGYCYVWHCQIAKRGAVEIGSCLWQFLLSEKDRGIKNISFYSDGCGGQNKNRFIFAFYLFAAQKLEMNITHRFFETGHGQSEADSMHSRIESELKNRVVYTPEQMYSIILNAKVNGELYNVKEMTQNDFFDIKELITGKNWTKDESGQKIAWSKVMELNVSYLLPSKLRFKYDFDAEYSVMDTEINLRITPRSKRGARARQLNTPSSTEQELKIAYIEPLPVSKALHTDLKNLCKSGAIPSYYHGFYDSLTSVDAVGPETNDCDSSE